MKRLPTPKRYIGVVVLLLLLVAPFSAFSATLSMDYALGFNGAFQLKTWTPLTVLFENRGRATSGTVEVIVTSGSEYLRNIRQTTYAMELDLPYNSTKLCSFTILLETFIHDLQIRFRDGEQIQISQTVNLRPHYTTQRFALIVDDQISADVLAGLPQRLLPVNVRHVRFLPETWYGYESVEMLILEAGMVKSLREKQFEALTQWVQQGGYLVMAGSLNYGALSDQRIQRLLPIRILGQQQATDLPSLQSFCGHALTGSQPFLMLRASVAGAEVVLAEQETPIILQKSLGVGKLMFLAFDVRNLPFSRWKGRQAFWESVLARQPVRLKTGIEIENQTILEALLATIPISFPNAWMMVIFVGAYIILIRLLLRKIEHTTDKKWEHFRMLSTDRVTARKWVYLGYLCGAAVIFSMIGYGLFLYPTSRRNLVYNGLSFAYVAPEHEMAFGKQIVGLYPLQDVLYRLRFGSGLSPVTFLFSKTSDATMPDDNVLYSDQTGQYVKGRSQRWSPNFWMTTGQVEFPLQAQAQLTEQGLQIAVDNRTPYRILDGLIYVERRVFAIKEILPGAQYTKHISETEFQSAEPLDEGQIRQVARQFAAESSDAFYKNLQKHLAETLLFAVHEHYQSQEDVAYFVGWIPSGLMPIEFAESQAAGEHATLIAWEIPVEQ